ncbi:MAG: 4-deoxy-4-formamido-L-arabinose-phosphoundecaprenol deformylase [Candidatus Obscuribacterales bacterium]|nr:4-deoxy-4-formamido-L-arabinose-phosphoundecaprenol deformylase [Steroidobacteraceae bacterium]
MKLGLKIDVDTYRGTRDGVPALLRLLDKHQVRGTFLFSLGPDHTGRAIKRIFRPGFFSKVSRTSVVGHIGLKTAMYGVLLPGPNIGKRCASIMRDVRTAGHEVGIHTWDHVRWQDGIAGASAEWTECELKKAVTRFAEIFGEPARVHGAAGWQMNDHAIRMTAQFGFDYCSDGRGIAPFLPRVDNDVIRCPQLPTTLPTLDELIGLNGVDENNVASCLLKSTAAPPSAPHIYTLHTELEGGKLKPVFDALLTGWKAQGYSLTTTRAIYTDLNVSNLPIHRVAMGTVSGRSGTLMIQGEQVRL